MAERNYDFTEIKTRIIIRNDSAENWEGSTIILEKGEPAIEYDAVNKTAKIKFGDGTSTFSELPFSTLTPSEVSSLISAVESGESSKVTTVTTTGDGNAVTGGSISDDGTTLTLTKGTEFVPASGGIFSGDVTVSGDLTADNVKTSGEISITPTTNITLSDGQDHDISKITFVNTNKRDDDDHISIEVKYGAVLAASTHVDDTHSLMINHVDDVGIDGKLNVKNSINGGYLTSSNEKYVGDYGYADSYSLRTGNYDNEAEIRLLRRNPNPGVYTSQIELNAKNVVLSNAPTSDMHAATKKYVDDSVSAFTDTKITTVTTNGDGNTVTGGSISVDGTTLTLTKGQEFVPASGGTFTGDVTIDGDISSAHGISTESISYENLDLGNLSYNKVTLPGVTFEDSHSISAVTTEQLQNVPKQAIFDNTRLILKDDDNTGIYCLSSNGKKLDKFISIKNRPIFSGSDTYDSEITISSNTCNTSSVSIDSKYTYISGQLFMKNDVLRLATAPTSDMDAATKKYVDDSVSGIVSAVDAMKFKGTIGTSGTVADIASISSPSTGDTYKIITATSLTSEQSFDGAAHDLTVGDLVVYASNKWVFVPSGNEDVTTVKVAGSGDTVNVSTTAQTGVVVLGTAAGVNTTSTVTDSATTVPTSSAVKTYVDDSVSSISTDSLIDGENILILNGGSATE